MHFFWGGFDLAVTRFSGRPAPPRDGPAFMRGACSPEVISHGFWPGGGPVQEPAFYAYAVPDASRDSTRPQSNPTARHAYHTELGEFLLPYKVMRSTADPDRALRVHQQHLRAGRDAGGWDRAARSSGGRTSCACACARGARVARRASSEHVEHDRDEHERAGPRLPMPVFIRTGRVGDTPAR